MQPTDHSKEKRQTLLICLGLALVVLAAYLPLWHCGFVDFDDTDYIVRNEMIKQGLGWQGIAWAFTTFQSYNWHPLTWITYLLDYQLHGLSPIWFHATNLFLHLANSILLFLLLQRMTRARWPSALAAALFGVHPLHVESVAWISERKDVLSAFFWMLTVLAYVRYVEASKSLSVPNPNPNPNPSSPPFFYILSLFLFALGLMSKPMLVTLPFVLLLLDYWPLQRLRRPCLSLLVEKFPFFILTGLSSWISFKAQRLGGAVASLEVAPMGTRLANVPVSYARYIAKTFWPAHLAVFYPGEKLWPAGTVLGACLLLAFATLWAIRQIRTQPWLAVGWFWFLGMLVPVVGLVQIGGQSMADRYDYLPGIGLSIMLIWAAAEWVHSSAASWAAGFAALAVAACMAGTWLQVGYWKNSETLFGHAAEVTTDNGLMESDYGRALAMDGHLDDALPHLRKGVALKPNVRGVHFNLGNGLLAKGLLAEGFAEYEVYVDLKPSDPTSHFNFGNVLMEHGVFDDAIAQFQQAIQLDAEKPEYHYELGNALSRSGRTAEAISQYDLALHSHPDYIQACNNLAWILASNPDSALRNGAKAVALAARADQLSRGQNPLIQGTLAAAYAEVGDFAEAIATARHALQLAGPESNSPLAATLRAQLALYQSGSPFRDTSAARSAAPPAGR